MNLFLSRILLNDRKRETIRALASPQVFHGAIESAFHTNEDRNIGKRERILWRVDPLHGKRYLLLLSSSKPDLSSLIKQFGAPEDQPCGEVKEYDPFLSRLHEGQVWQFRLQANPVRSSPYEKDERTGRGKIFAHVTPQQQKLWLLKRAESCGFSLREDQFDVVHSEWVKFRKKTGGRQVILRTATFEGILQINDAEKFRISLIEGIGRAKAYGCGLMTLMGVRS